MKSINGINWKVSNIPERKILKNKQNFNISYLLSKVFLDKEYTEEEIHNSIHKTHQIELIYRNKDFENASDFISKSLINKKKYLFLEIMMLMVILPHIYFTIIYQVLI